jgi:hypothetical protein
MIIKSLELFVWLGIIGIMAYTMYRLKRTFLLSVRPAIDHMQSMIQGCDSSRLFYLGGAYTINGNYKGIPVTLSADFAHFKLQMDKKIAGRPKEPDSMGRPAIRIMEDSRRMTCHLDIRRLQGENFDQEYLEDVLETLWNVNRPEPNPE